MLFGSTNAVRHPALSGQSYTYRASPTTAPAGQVRAFPARPQVEREEEDTVVARFVARVDALGPLFQPSPALQAYVLEEVKTVGLHIDGSAEAGAMTGYDRRVLYEEPDRWSLAAIILRPGQQTEQHNHSGWGCAVTVQGVERDRRFVHDPSGNLMLSSERDYPPGAGYVFDAVDVHQPEGADPRQVTVALHFLVHGSDAEASAS